MPMGSMREKSKALNTSKPITDWQPLTVKLAVLSILMFARQRNYLSQNVSHSPTRIMNSEVNPFLIIRVTRMPYRLYYQIPKIIAYMEIVRLKLLNSAKTKREPISYGKPIPNGVPRFFHAMGWA